MFRRIITKIGNIVNPYIKTLIYIIVISFLVLLTIYSCSLINEPSTIQVILGFCGLGLVVTYITEFFKNTSKKEK